MNRFKASYGQVFSSDAGVDWQVGMSTWLTDCVGKSLKQQAEALAGAHVYILIHGAAMALYMFLPKHAAIIEVSSS